MARVTIIVERRLAGTMLMKNERRFACDGMNLKTAADGAFFFFSHRNEKSESHNDVNSSPRSGDADHQR
jgi:hypothetical protein